MFIMYTGTYVYLQDVNARVTARALEMHVHVSHVHVSHVQSYLSTPDHELHHELEVGWWSLPRSAQSCAQL